MFFSKERTGVLMGGLIVSSFNKEASSLIFVPAKTRGKNLGQLAVFIVSLSKTTMLGQLIRLRRTQTSPSQVIVPLTLANQDSSPCPKNGLKLSFYKKLLMANSKQLIYRQSPIVNSKSLAGGRG